MVILNFHNPFTRLKFRYLALRFICISLILGLISAILRESGFLSLFKINQLDSAFIFYTIQLVLLCLWLLKDFQRLRIKLKYIIGELPEYDNWLRFARLALPSLIFSIGAYIVVFYFMSLLAPSFLKLLPPAILNSPTVQRPNFFESNIFINLMFSVIISIAEEFIFRGVILQRFCTKWGIGAGLFSSSLLDGCFHASPILLSFFGIILGLSYIKTRSLIVPIAFNAVYNILVTSTQLLSGNSETGKPLEQLLILHAYWWVGIVLMGISLPFLLRFLLSNWPRENTLIPYLSNANEEQAIIRNKTI
jgi:uncharacterized protein